jgi:hypothetical protein
MAMPSMNAVSTTVAAHTRVAERAAQCTEPQDFEQQSGSARGEESERQPHRANRSRSFTFQNFPVEVRGIASRNS